MGLAQRTCIPRRTAASTSVLTARRFMEAMEEWDHADDRVIQLLAATPPRYCPARGSPTESTLTATPVLAVP